MFKRNMFIVVLCLLVFSGWVTPMVAQEAHNDRTVGKHVESEANRADDAAKVLTEIIGIPENAIPEDLMARAHGIAVIPHVVKGAFGLGGRWGKGLVSQRREDGMWSTPSYIQITGGSFGLQLGVQATDLVLVFTDEKGIEPLLKGKVQIGADASAAAGPVGRNAALATDILLRSAIFTYSRAKGLFAGVSLDGSAVTIDDDANRKVYGKDLNGEDILLRAAARANSTVEPFMTALKNVSPPHVHATISSR